MNGDGSFNLFEIHTNSQNTRNWNTIPTISYQIHIIIRLDFPKPVNRKRNLLTEEKKISSHILYVQWYLMLPYDYHIFTDPSRSLQIAHTDTTNLDLFARGLWLIGIFVTTTYNLIACICSTRRDPMCAPSRIQPSCDLNNLFGWRASNQACLADFNSFSSNWI